MKLRKLLLLGLIQLVMILYLPFSCVSQIITVDNKRICFDEKAALLLEGYNKSRMLFDSVQCRIIETQDSSLSIRNNQIEVLTGMVEKCKSENISIQRTILKNDVDCKKKKLKSFLTGTGTGVLIIALLVIVL